MTTAAVPLDAVLAVRPLSIVPEGEEFLVGDPAQSEYVLLPAVGVEVIRLLESGHTVGEAVTEIGAHVDVLDFVATLLELGFASREPANSATRASRVPPRLVRPLFGRVAWTLYAACAVIGVTILTSQPQLFPRSDDLFFLPSPLASFACVTLLVYILAACHEVCHWAAARAEGLSATLTISRRLYFLAFETDLSQLWSLPRRRRYSALLAGMAFDAVVLCAALIGRLGDAGAWWHLAPGVGPFLGALASVQLAAIAAQFYVFLRTDMYAVLITATGCVNLWRVNQLRLLSRVRRLSSAQQRELAEAHPRDVVVARWYAWVYVAGLSFALVFLVAYFLPATVRLIGWIVATLAGAQFLDPEFWSALALAVIVLSPTGLTLAVAIRDLLRHGVNIKRFRERARMPAGNWGRRSAL